MQRRCTKTGAASFLEPRKFRPPYFQSLGRLIFVRYVVQRLKMVAYQEDNVRELSLPK
jgi:hypothetical protein